LASGPQDGLGPKDHKVGATVAEIDRLLYDLYSVTNEEREIIEGT
jgi:hypothetical protein